MNPPFNLLQSIVLLSSLSPVLLLTDPQGCTTPCEDTDNDGLCDSEDQCPGYDDRLDADGNGFPDACQDFVLVTGSGFTLNAEPFHFVGSNTYYLMTFAADPNLRPYVDEVLEEAALLGVTVVRTWAFNDGPNWNALQPSPGVFDESVFQGLDYVVARCAALGLRLVLPLVNNWSDYGGMDQYIAWSPTASRHDEFYTDAYTRQYYRDFASAVPSRVNTLTGMVYRDDPTIMAWELANEPRCASDPSGDTLVAWIDEMSTFLKGMDSRHLVTTGLEGFYGQDIGPGYQLGASGTDFVRDHQPANIDYAVAHSWPDTWGLDYEATMALVERQIGDSSTILGKPFVLEEFGKLRDGAALSLEEGTTTRDAYYTAWLERIYASKSGGAMYWIAYHDDYPDYDGYGVYYPADESTVALLSEYARLMTGLE